MKQLIYRWWRWQATENGNAIMGMVAFFVLFALPLLVTCLVIAL